MLPANLRVIHGYTLDEIDHLARAAVKLAGAYASDYLDRLDAAYGAIVICLCEASDRPVGHSLIRAGADAINQMVESERHMYGYRNRNGYEGASSAPRYATYWREYLVTPSPESRIVEHLAIDQILDGLTKAEQKTVAALALAYATDGNAITAAAACGVPHSTFVNRLNRVRHKVFVLWHEQETPPASLYRTVRAPRRHFSRPTHCPRGHEYSPDNIKMRRRGKLDCKRCHREREAARKAGTHVKKALKPCGTYAAYQRHLYHGEPIDPSCEAAAEEYKAFQRRSAA